MRRRRETESGLSTRWGSFVGRFDRDRTTNLRPIPEHLFEHRGRIGFPDAHGPVVPASRKHYGSGTPDSRVDPYLLMARENLEERSSRAVPDIYMAVFPVGDGKKVSTKRWAQRAFEDGPSHPLSTKLSCGPPNALRTTNFPGGRPRRRWTSLPEVMSHSMTS